VFVLAADQPQAQYPQLRQSMVLADIESETGFKLWSYILYLQASSEAVLQPHWRMVQMGPEKHRGYAVQWFGLALTLLVMYVYRLRQYLLNSGNKDIDK
jgi:cytochrome oxidase assembly protein ShyY1